MPVFILVSVSVYFFFMICACAKQRAIIVNGQTEYSIAFSMRIWLSSMHVGVGICYLRY